MIRLNLLPHREQKRQARKKQFISLSISIAILGLAVVALVHVIMASRIENQNSRNALLKSEIAKLDEQIKEIDRLREQTQALLARKQIVETLQTNRTEAVHLIDQIVRQIPDGYLPALGEAVRQPGDADRLRPVERARLDADAQYRELALARKAGAGRNQVGAAAGRAGQRIHAEPGRQARDPARSGAAAREKGRRRARSARSLRMTLDDLRRLSLRDVGSWPLLPKILALAFIFVVILVAGALVDWKDQYDALNAAEQVEAKLRVQYTEKKAKAINYELYRQQLFEIEQSFGALVKQLPNRAEMDALLTDINQAGLGRGLQFELFKPAAQERMADFYAELPINIRITGNYHDMGAFASDIAQLPRIVTLNDVSINNDKGVLAMDAVAKTYRYLDEEEVAKQRRLAAQAKEGAKK